MLTVELRHLHEGAAHAVGRLDGVWELAGSDPLLELYLRAEALHSARLIGSEATLVDLLRFEREGVADCASAPTPDDVQRLARLLAAMRHGAQRLRSGSLPLGLDLIWEIHQVLTSEGVSSGRREGWPEPAARPAPRHRPRPPTPAGTPGSGPPRSHPRAAALHDLERFLDDRDAGVPPILKAGLAHARFELVRPFARGNRRVGRILVGLVLDEGGALPGAFLPLSAYFAANPGAYRDALRGVRVHWNWEGWLRFYLLGVESTATWAHDTLVRLDRLFEEDEGRVQGLGRAAGSALRVLGLLREPTVISIPEAAEALGLTWPTVNAAVQRLMALGIATEVTGRPRNRLYAYAAPLELLEGGIINVNGDIL